jgi:hypothetical protein
LTARRELRLGQHLYFVLWDEDAGEAGVAKGEVVQYASDYSKVRVKVIDAPQRTVIGRTTWVLPERLDDDPRSARRNYQRRAREQLRAELASQAAGTAAAQEEGAAVAEAAEAAATGAAGLPPEAAAHWRRVAEGWPDVDLLVETIDFEAGWPEHQARLAKFAVMAVLALRPAILALLEALPAGDEVAAVRAALETGALGTAARLCGDEPSALLARWAEVPAGEVAAAADDVTGLRSALAELAARYGLQPPLPEAAASE